MDLAGRPAVRRWSWLALALALAACGNDETHLSRDQLLDPETCKTCHPDQFREWSGSMHAYAADDPVFVAMNARGATGSCSRRSDRNWDMRIIWERCNAIGSRTRTIQTC